jgi:hypothetical protein
LVTRSISSRADTGTWPSTKPPDMFVTS